jgi:hypothetical protein
VFPPVMVFGTWSYHWPVVMYLVVLLMKQGLLFLGKVKLWSRPSSSVCITTGYGLDDPGIESRWGRDIPHLSRPVLGAYPGHCTLGTGSFPGVESDWGVTLTPHPLLVPRSKNRVDYTSTLPKGLRGLQEGEIYLCKALGCSIM